MRRFRVNFPNRIASSSWRARATRWIRFLAIATPLAICAIWIGWQVALAAPEIDDAELPEPIFVRQPKFRIPFDFDKGDEASRRNLTVFLFASEDQGATWRLATKALASERAFPFRGIDGEYGFLTKAAGRDGRPVPPQPNTRPEIRVVVDTIPPQVELTVERGETRQSVHAAWRVVDVNPNSRGVEIEYRVGKSWENVAVDPLTPDEAPNSYSGSATWLPANGDESITVRVTVRDQAGNIASQTQRIESARDAGSRSRDEGPRGWDRDENDDDEELPDPKSSESSMGRRSRSGANSARTRLTRSQENAKGRARADEARRPNSDRPTMTRRFPSEGELEEDTYDGEVISAPRGEPASPLEGDLGAPSGASGDRRRATSDGESGGTFSSWGIELPEGTRPRMINYKRFKLEYDVEQLGSSGVRQVELWWTHDGGKTWRSYGFDQDNVSPVVVNVPDEGLYGFRMVIENGAGLRGAAPEPGELPEIWVGVDLTEPIGKLTSIEPGQGATEGALVIRWEASDLLLASRPISLSFAETPDGEYHVLAAGLENTGEYAWSLDSRAPSQVYLRLEARDEAGNTLRWDEKEPVSTTPARPRGRILDARPASEAALRRSRQR